MRSYLCGYTFTAEQCRETIRIALSAAITRRLREHNRNDSWTHGVREPHRYIRNLGLIEYYTDYLAPMVGSSMNKTLDLEENGTIDQIADKIVDKYFKTQEVSK